MDFIGIDDFLENLSELIVLLPVVVLIFGPMLVRAMRRRQSAPGSGKRKDKTPSASKKQGSGAVGEAAAQPAPAPRLRPRKLFPAVVSGRQRPAALRITRQQVLRRETAIIAPPRPAEREAPVSLEEHLRESALQGSERMQTLPQAGARFAYSGAGETETLRAGAGRRRLEALSPLKKAILWAEILGKPKGW
jgi:hypothetical protein